jgi:hypothetical protein
VVIAELVLRDIQESGLEGGDKLKREFFFLALGVLLAMVLQSTIASFANPYLASLKLSYS